MHKSANTFVDSQVPAQEEHSCIGVLPTRTYCIALRHDGQRSRVVSSSNSRDPFAPQFGQNCMPTNIVPKQDGHAMTDSADPQ
jgi:hypothetical protein